MAKPTVYGPDYSTYVRTVRLTLDEKGVPYDHVDVKMLEGEHKKPDHLQRNPFGYVPAFEHDGMMLYETGAISRYIDRAFAGPALQPGEPTALARMDQIISIVDSFAYPSIITRVVMQRIVAPMLGGKADEAIIESGLERARMSLSEIERLQGGAPFLAGPTLSLADLHVVPIFDYLLATPEADKVLPKESGLRAWWQRMSDRPSLARTKPRLG
jgi:glutathione S-transferase